MHRSLRDQRGARDMRPRQLCEIQEHCLHILNLRESNIDGSGLCDVMMRMYFELWPGLPVRANTSRGVDQQCWLPMLEDRHCDLSLHLLDPERGHHSSCLRVRAYLGASGTSLKESDVGCTTTKLGGARGCGDREDDCVGDVLVLDSPEEYKIWIVQNVLGYCTSRNEVG